MSRICIIGQFPPPMHGLSKALNTLYSSRLNIKYRFSKIDIKDNNKFLFSLLKILFEKSELYYLTIAQSRLGNIRDLIIIRLIQLKRKKVIIHLHGGGFRNSLDNEFGKIQKLINFRVLSNVNAAIVLGDSLRYIFEGIIPKNRIFVVKNCVDNEFVISDNEFKLKINKLKEKKEMKILYLSNFIKEKGYQRLLEIARLSKNTGNYKFVFAGKFFNDKDRKEFFKYVDNNNLNTIVEYKGVVGGKEKRKLLSECDIFVLLSTYKNEGQPISIIEAISNGLLVVSTDHAGIQDIVNKNNALIFEKYSISEKKVFEEIAKVTQDTNKMIEYIIESREFYKNNFTENKYIYNMDKIFSMVLRDKEEFLQS